MSLRVVIALDSFKGSVTSTQANAAVARGVASAMPDAVVTQVPVADGGEGTLDALASIGTTRAVAVADLLGRALLAPYVMLGDVAVVESASTVGLSGLGAPNPSLARRAHSFGLGLQLLAVAERERPTRVLVGLGGTGCTDGGVGMLRALGARIWLEGGAELWPDRAPRDENPLLARPVRVELPPVDVALVGLADVASPLLGPTGAARMFGPQKGADPGLVTVLEEAMDGWANALADAGADVGARPGAGAAGGLGAAVLALGGALEPGCARLVRETGMGSVFAGADLVITGEGALDAQTRQGKVPAAIAVIARRAGAKRVVALAGRMDATAEDVAAIGLDDAHGIHDDGPWPSDPLDPAVTGAALSRAAEEVVRGLSASG